MKFNRGVAKRLTVATAVTGTVLSMPALASAHFGKDLLSKGSHGEEVKDLQTVLKQEGYYKFSKPTGYFGKATETAVKKFQKDHEIKVDGLVGPQTKGKLENYVKYPGHLINVGDTGKVVKQVQDHLVDLGYYKGSKDGIYGPRTKSAVEEFQQVNDLHVDGIVGPHTYEVLHNSPKEAPAKNTTHSEKQETKKTSRSSKSSSSKVIFMNSTAYTAFCSGCSGITATGINLRTNPDAKVIAVDPDVIPLGTKVYVEGYGYAVAGDTGGAINGNRIDLFMASRSDALHWGRKTVKVTILK